jgi:hypothetical protein
MNEKTKEYLILGGIGAVVLFVILKVGRTNSSGIAFAAPNPASVSAVENATAMEIQSNNDLILGKAKINADLLGMINGQMQATEQDRIAVSGAESIATIQGNTATQLATINTNGTIAIADVASRISRWGINSSNYQAGLNAATADNLANKYAATAKTSSWLGFFNNLISGIMTFFAPHPSTPTPPVYSGTP